jgi:hypothetical protein
MTKLINSKLIQRVFMCINKESLLRRNICDVIKFPVHLNSTSYGAHVKFSLRSDSKNRKMVHHVFGFLSQAVSHLGPKKL